MGYFLFFATASFKTLLPNTNPGEHYEAQLDVDPLDEHKCACIVLRALCARCAWSVMRARVHVRVCVLRARVRVARALRVRACECV